MPRNGFGVDQFVVHWVALPSFKLSKILLGLERNTPGKGPYYSRDKPALHSRLSHTAARNGVAGWMAPEGSRLGPCLKSLGPEKNKNVIGVQKFLRGSWSVCPNIGLLRNSVIFLQTLQIWLKCRTPGGSSPDNSPEPLFVFPKDSFGSAVQVCPESNSAQIR